MTGGFSFLAAPTSKYHDKHPLVGLMSEAGRDLLAPPTFSSSKICAKISAFDSPQATKTALEAAFSVFTDMEIRLGGGLGESSSTMMTSEESRDDRSGKRLAVCPSGPSPRTTMSGAGNSASPTTFS